MLLYTTQFLRYARSNFSVGVKMHEGRKNNFCPVQKRERYPEVFQHLKCDLAAYSLVIEKGINVMMIGNACKTAIRVALVATSGVLFFAASGQAAMITGGDTSVALNASTVNALVGLGFSIAPIAPATLTGLTADFPITGGDTTGMIDHSGGLAFTDNGVTSDIENFVINTTDDVLTGDLIVPGFGTNTGVAFFDIGAGGSLTLDAALAGGLSAVYAIPNLTGAPIGTATVSAITAATPEPGTASIAGLGLLLAIASVFGRRRIACQSNA